MGRKSIRSVSTHPPLQDPGCPLSLVVPSASLLPAREGKKEERKEKAQIFLNLQQDSRNVQEKFYWPQKRNRNDRSIRVGVGRNKQGKERRTETRKRGIRMRGRTELE